MMNDGLGDNAYHDFTKLAAAMKVTPEERDWLVKQLESATPDWPALEALIARNEAALAHHADFARRSGYLDPNYADPSKIALETPIPLFWPLVSAARLESMRAARLAAAGRGPEALERALTILEAGQVLLRSEPPLIVTLVGILMIDIGAKRIQALIDNGALDRASLGAAARRLAGYRSSADALATALRFEYVAMANVLDRLAQVAARPPDGKWYYGLSARIRYLFLPNRTRGYFVERFRQVVAGVPQPCSAEQPPEPAPFSMHPGPNIVGRIFANIGMPTFRKIYSRRCESDYRIRSAAAAAAIAAYRLDRRANPASLAELAPDYLDAVPLDSFSGKPLEYSAATGKVRTAGRDTGGKPL